MRLREAAAAALLALLALAGCSGQAADDGSAQAPAAGSAPRAPDAEGGGGDAEGDPHGELVCDEDTLSAIDETIAGQLEAFVAGDYEAALGFATEGFRSGTTPEAFRDVIEQDYPLLREASGHTSTYCVAEADDAQLLVTVDGAEGRSDDLIYRMTREDGDWRVAVAAHPPEAAPTEETVPV